jgi:replicative DNA helicase
MELTMKAPYDEDLEELVLGTILLEGTAYYRVAQIINEKTFYSKKHQIIFRAIRDLNNKRSPIDIMTVTQWLLSKGLADDVGGAYHISIMTNRVASSANLEAHASILFKYHVRRELIETSSYIFRASHDLSQDIMSVLEKAKSDLFSKTTTAINNARTVGFHADQIIKEAAESDGTYVEVRGVPSGFEKIDKCTSGFIGGRFYIFAARPSMGKTTFVINAIINAVKKFKKKVLFFSGEMSGQEITSIIMAKMSGIPIKHVQSNMVTDWKKVLDEFDDDFRENLIIDDTPAPSLMHVQSKSISMKEQEDIDMIVVDYLQLMKVNEKGIKKGEAVGKISGALKELARRLDVPVIALSQLSRGCESRPDPLKRPVLSDLRESGEIEQDADFIAFLYRPEYYNEKKKEDGRLLDVTGWTEIIVRKNRQGPLGLYMTFFEKEIGRFYDFNMQFKETIPLSDYDMSITKPKLLSDVFNSYASDAITVDADGDELPF